MRNQQLSDLFNEMADVMEMETVGSEVHLLQSLRKPAEVERSQCLRTFEGHLSNVSAVKLLPHGKWALSASLDCTLKLWDLDTGDCRRTLRGHTNGIYDITVFPEGKSALSASGDNTLKLWNIINRPCRLIESLETNAAKR